MFIFSTACPGVHTFACVFACVYIQVGMCKCQCVDVHYSRAFLSACLYRLINACDWNRMACSGKICSVRYTLDIVMTA